MQASYFCLSRVREAGTLPENQDRPRRNRPRTETGPPSVRAERRLRVSSLLEGNVGMHDQSDPSAAADQAIADLKKNVGQAIIQTEDAMDKMGQDVSAATQVAEDYRAKVFDYMRGNVNAALDYAASLATLKTPAEFAGLVQRDGGGASPADLSAAATAAEEYRQRMFEFMKANLNAALDYAEQLSAVKSPSDLVELSTSHARKQFEALTAQSTELGMLAQRLTAWNGDAFSGFSKLFSPPRR
ncbi:hypothetical protein GJ689_09920 [Rhodoplanes serenus]|uniref:Phasin domain-containing protein n=2 Tax=Rhodoplanes serenus TaxID=200615 RepID=A0A327JU71_9BRAD|nr:phasin family protein [Rhodoplanes serenus]MTW16526.1 hypothetical protein [Rhodoplanes serenus]RAI29056.1 hypothetical protein CH340_23130 [Rhodoplanes serenus]